MVIVVWRTVDQFCVSYSKSHGVTLLPQNVTEAILNLLSTTGKLVPIRTNNIVIFPSSLPWKKTVCNQLLFSYNGLRLQPHSQIIFLLVHIHTSMSPKTPVTQLQTSEFLSFSTPVCIVVFLDSAQNCNWYEYLIVWGKGLIPARSFLLSWPDGYS